MAKTNVVVQQNDDAPIEKKVLAQAIVDISKGMRLLTASGLNRRAIVVLLQDSTNVGKPAIRAVLDGLTQLAKDYTA